MNKYGKYLAVNANGTINPADNRANIIRSHCNSQEKGQLWRVMGDHLCNGWNKCLSLPNNSDQEYLNLYIVHTYLHSDSWRQKFKFENPGRILNFQGRCLGAHFSSDSDGGNVKM